MSYFEKVLENLEESIIEYCDENEIEIKWSPKNLSKRFSNFHGKFQYLVMDNDEIYVSMRKDTFRTFEYYLGMQYEEERILLKIQTERDVIVIYENSERLQSILELDEEELDA